MSFAEVVLRTGCGLVAWMLAFVHGLTLAVIPAVDCATAGDPWLGALAVAVPSAGIPLLLGYAGRLEAVRAPLRWLLLPWAALAVLAIRPLLQALGEVTWGGGALCAAAPQSALFGSEGLARAWAPFQLAVAAAIAWSAWRFFRREAS